MYITIADVVDRTFTSNISRDIKISETLLQAKLNLIEELQDEELTIIQDISSEYGWLYYAKAMDDEALIMWRITEIKFDEYFGIC